MLIVIEGVSDCIGKSTQVKELYKRLEQDGKDVIYHHFPSYGESGACLVEMYLNGKLGNREDINPYAVSTFFAMDRFCVYKNKLERELNNNNNKIVLLDRYTTSNLIYQGALFEREEKEDFLDYVSDFEYNKLGLKRPDLVIFLKLDKDDVNTLRENRDNESKDVNEKDLNFLDKVYDNSLYVANKYNFKIIECNKDGKLRSIDDINEEIYSIVKNII